MSTLGICKLCELDKELQLSHAIGNAVFKRIFKTNSGKGITIRDNNSPIDYSSDSWAELQLCSVCERHLNDEYERYSLKALRDHRNCVKTPTCLTFRGVDQYKLMLYFLSIYYRSALSSQRPYQNTHIIKQHQKRLKEVLLGNQYLEYNEIPVKISRVIDRKAGGFSQENIKEILCAPFTRVSEGERKTITTCFLFEGFFIEIFITGFRFKNRNKHGILNKGKDNLYVPYKDLFSIPEIVDLMVLNLGKYQDGNHSIKD